MDVTVSTPTQRPGGSQSLEVQELSLIVDQGGLPLFPLKTLQTVLSRKSSQRGDRAAINDGSAVMSPPSPMVNTGGTATVEAAAEKFIVVEVPQVSAADVVMTSQGQGRRPHSRRAAPWLHPRNVLVFFATLSTMGTILLLYFTLAMGQMSRGDIDSR